MEKWLWYVDFKNRILKQRLVKLTKKQKEELDTYGFISKIAKKQIIREIDFSEQFDEILEKELLHLFGIIRHQIRNLLKRCKHGSKRIYYKRKRRWKFYSGLWTLV